MKAPYQQVELKYGTVSATVNLPVDSRLRPGARLTLKDHEMGDVVWTVVWMSPHIHEKADLRTTGAWWSIQ